MLEVVERRSARSSVSWLGRRQPRDERDTARVVLERGVVEPDGRRSGRCPGMMRGSGALRHWKGPFGFRKGPRRFLRPSRRGGKESPASGQPSSAPGVRLRHRLGGVRRQACRGLRAHCFTHGRNSTVEPQVQGSTERHNPSGGSGSSIDRAPTRADAEEEVFRFYKLAKRAEWQVRDLPWGELPPIPELRGLAAAAGAPARRLALGGHPAAPGRRARRRDVGAALLARAHHEAKLYYTTMVQDESRHTEAWLQLVEQAGGRASATRTSTSWGRIDDRRRHARGEGLPDAGVLRAADHPEVPADREVLARARCSRISATGSRSTTASITAPAWPTSASCSGRPVEEDEGQARRGGEHAAPGLRRARVLAPARARLDRERDAGRPTSRGSAARSRTASASPARSGSTWARSHACGRSVRARSFVLRHRRLARPLGNLMCSGAMTGLPTSSWIWGSLGSGSRRGRRSRPCRRRTRSPSLAASRSRSSTADAPDGEELAEPEGLLLRRLDVDDAVGGMRMEPHEAAAAGDERAGGGVHALERRADADSVGDLEAWPVDEERQVGVDMVGDLLDGLAGDRRRPSGSA